MIVQGVPVLGADGCVDAGPVVLDDCCAPPLCGTELCKLICSFINLLPQGPMWDYWKQKALASYSPGVNPEDPPCLPDVQCPSLVYHAIYAAFKMQEFVYTMLWPVVRESNPSTAETSVGNWLMTLEWEDCYAQNCRSVLLGELTPYEILDACGNPLYCPPNISDELRCALDRAILLSLSRAQMGGIKNLCWINWVIEPLGAVLTPRNVADCVAYSCDDTCDPLPDTPTLLQCVEWELSPVGDTLPACLENTGPCSTPVRGTVPAFIEGNTCDTPLGLPLMVWPGVIAAACIVRSLLPVACPNKIFLSCGDI